MLPAISYCMTTITLGGHVRPIQYRIAVSSDADQTNPFSIRVRSKVFMEGPLR